MKLILIIILVSFFSANLILVQQNFILNKIDRYQFFCAKNILFFLAVMSYMIFINKDVYKNLKNMELSIYE